LTNVKKGIELKTLVSGKSKTVLDMLEAEYLFRGGDIESAYELSQKSLSRDQS